MLCSWKSTRVRYMFLTVVAIFGIHRPRADGGPPVPWTVENRMAGSQSILFPEIAFRRNPCIGFYG